MTVDKANSTAQSRLFVVAAPSGAGKTSIVKALLERDEGIRFSTSYTTRPKRDKEKDSVDYKFVIEEEFLKKANAGDFLEHAQVFDHYYATGRAEVRELLDNSYNVLLEIDWQGARQVREAMPEAVTVFILPPTVDELERRLRGRSTDDDTVIARRLRDSLSDLSHWEEFDYVIVNDDFDTAVDDMQAIIRRDAAEYSSNNPDVRAFATSLLD
jgi:guanylate kinase